jgi:hypothetical protein
MLRFTSYFMIFHWIWWREPFPDVFLQLIACRNSLSIRTSANSAMIGQGNDPRRN